MVMERSRCREEEPTKNYIKLVLARQTGHGMMPNTVREGQGISFLKLSGNPVTVVKRVGCCFSLIC